MGLFNAHLISYLVPRNLNSNYNFGFLLGILFIFQIVSGLLLTFNYVPTNFGSFESIVKVLFDVNFGWGFRYFHSQGVSFCFLFLWLHIIKGLLYSSKYLPWSWYSGMVILILSMAIAFLGYVLPNGQMSYWGATVITNLFYWAPDFVTVLLGGYSVGENTLQRFYILHFLLPFVLLFFVIIHIYFLHRCSSTNPLSCVDSYLVVRFYPLVILNDCRMFVILLSFIFFQLGFGLISLFQGDVDNSILANPLQTPQHIVPEWYLLVFYATLKLFPSKLAGLIAMAFLLEVFIILIESRSISNILPCVYYHRVWGSFAMVIVPSMMVLGSLGKMVINSKLLIIGVFLFLAIILLSLKMLDNSRLRR
uniref:Cytochrome b n=1 Tax=Theileria equi TaxID=5872 RepID=D2KWE7_THEEQ|nr:cytochrome b [Theileria equi]